MVTHVLHREASREGHFGLTVYRTDALPVQYVFPKAQCDLKHAFQGLLEASRADKEDWDKRKG